MVESFPSIPKLSCWLLTPLRTQTKMFEMPFHSTHLSFSNNAHSGYLLGVNRTCPLSSDLFWNLALSRFFETCHWNNCHGISSEPMHKVNQKKSNLETHLTRKRCWTTHEDARGGNHALTTSTRFPHRETRWTLCSLSYLGGKWRQEKKRWEANGSID